jgi:hypothetical protein
MCYHLTSCFIMGTSVLTASTSSTSDMDMSDTHVVALPTDYNGESHQFQEPWSLQLKRSVTHGLGI